MKKKKRRRRKTTTVPVLILKKIVVTAIKTPKIAKIAKKVATQKTHPEMYIQRRAKRTRRRRKKVKRVKLPRDYLRLQRSSKGS